LDSELPRRALQSIVHPERERNGDAAVDERRAWPKDNRLDNRPDNRQGNRPDSRPSDPA
jgi:hypothetical protein